jgi:hypothetical protein
MRDGIISARMRSFAFLLVASLAFAKPQPKPLKPQPQPLKPQAKQLKSLPPATQMLKSLARDAEDVRLLILASPT